MRVKEWLERLEGMIRTPQRDYRNDPKVTHSNMKSSFHIRIDNDKRMKIGILTYHRAENYGALLQAYAMMTYLQSQGHEVTFVDYWPKYHSDYFRLFPWQQLSKRSGYRKILFLIQLVLWLVPRYIRKKKFHNFMYHRLNLTKLPQYSDRDSKTARFDVVLYGSDQIWRKQNLGGVGFDDWYFGTDHVLADRKIVYAGSMGTVDTTAEDDEYIQKMMLNFNALSVREKDLQLYLAHLGISAILVPDPVFLLSKDQWKSLIKKKESKGNYILFYNLLYTCESKLFVEKLSHEKNLPIREVNKKMQLSHFMQNRYISTASVEQFLQLIEGAEYVVSNSFHGVAMSVIFEKQFYAVGMGSKANRVLSLLESVGIKERYITTLHDLPSSQIDYNKVHDSLNEVIGQSADFLQRAL